MFGFPRNLRKKVDVRLEGAMACNTVLEKEKDEPATCPAERGWKGAVGN
jgi:hypothetical protein